MSLPRYPNYKDSGVEWLGEVPDGWTPTRLRFLLRDGYDGLKIGPFGSQLTSEMLEDTGSYKVYGQENVIAGDFNRGGRFIGSSKFDELAVYEILPGDLLITMMGTSGRCDVAPADMDKGIMDSHLLRMRVNKSVHAEFVRLLIDEAVYVGTQIQLAGKGSIMHGLNSSIVKNLLLLLPPLSEQTQIAAFLDRETAKIDELVAEQRRLMELLKEKRQVVISHAVTRGLNPDVPLKPSGVEWLGDVPEHWEVGPLKRYWSVTDCKHLTADFVEEGIPLASIREVQSRWVTLKSAKCTTEYYYELLIEGGRCPRPGDLIFSRNATVGEVAQVSVNHPRFAMGQDVVLLRKLSQEYSSDFLQHVIRSPIIILQLANMMIGSTFKRINVEEIRSFVMPSPPAKEQSEISAYLEGEIESFETLTTEAQRAIDLLQERRTALISAAVTGVIDIRNAV